MSTYTQHLLNLLILHTEFAGILPHSPIFTPAFADILPDSPTQSTFPDILRAPYIHFPNIPSVSSVTPNISRYSLSPTFTPAFAGAIPSIPYIHYLLH